MNTFIVEIPRSVRNLSDDFIQSKFDDWHIGNINYIRRYNKGQDEGLIIYFDKVFDEQNKYVVALRKGEQQILYYLDTEYWTVYLYDQTPDYASPLPLAPTLPQPNYSIDYIKELENHITDLSIRNAELEAENAKLEFMLDKMDNECHVIEKDLEKLDNDNIITNKLLEDKNTEIDRLKAYVETQKKYLDEIVKENDQYFTCAFEWSDEKTKFQQKINDLIEINSKLMADFKDIDIDINIDIDLNDKNEQSYTVDTSELSYPDFYNTQNEYDEQPHIDIDIDSEVEAIEEEYIYKCNICEQYCDLTGKYIDLDQIIDDSSIVRETIPRCIMCFKDLYDKMGYTGMYDKDDENTSITAISDELPSVKGFIKVEIDENM
jgi:hypothetical protein